MTISSVTRNAGWLKTFAHSRVWQKIQKSTTGPLCYFQWNPLFKSSVHWQTTHSKMQQWQYRAAFCHFPQVNTSELKAIIYTMELGHSIQAKAQLIPQQVSIQLCNLNKKIISKVNYTISAVFMHKAGPNITKYNLACFLWMFDVVQLQPLSS